MISTLLVFVAGVLVGVGLRQYHEARKRARAAEVRRLQRKNTQSPRVVGVRREP